MVKNQEESKKGSSVPVVGFSTSIEMQSNCLVVRSVKLIKYLRKVGVSLHTLPCQDRSVAVNLATKIVNCSRIPLVIEIVKLAFLAERNGNVLMQSTQRYCLCKEHLI